ncbi:uncharacterized protein TRIVIDRAFT_60656 [Trichoderma virens Gv29-8]|uniref:Uncharacterized protein n=1 Tax=Hypocrea virens (strain Gv29-8 / FGSC 10586) TaxID=413071 RepID=G9MQW1_HYPVG|nr:uncharacterized protein TRIVIDRAFT_60656 [Trichoderma virens Gv29-8]EHK22490.1 hypothetical protein TRIVIDRAFT_60656 [Trichoderma virens Gv29-8]
MAPDNAHPPLSRRQTSKGDAFRDYARLRFDKRAEIYGPMTEEQSRIKKIIEEEKRRISKIRGRFNGNESKSKLFRNVAESRKALIPHLKETATARRIFDHKMSIAHAEQEAEGDNPPTNLTLSGLNEPVEEFKAGVMYFEKEDDKKWQANHMEWIETALEKYHNVNSNDGEPQDEDDQTMEATDFKSQLLSREYWRGQLHGAGIGKDLIHLRYMRPRCAHISGWLFQRVAEYANINPPDIEDHTDHSAPSNIAVFLPYLHWETNRRRAKMTQIVQEVVEDNRASLNSRFIELAGVKAPCLRPKFNRMLIPSKIGLYLYDIAQIWDAMDYEADERLLRQSFSEPEQDGPSGVKWEPPLHIRRTLDQSFFSTVEDTTARDTDQVVYRQTRARKQKHHSEELDDTSSTSGTITSQRDPFNESTQNTAIAPTIGTTFGSTSSSDTAKKKKIMKLVGVTRVVMVDQLWMWILGEATLIIDQCSKVFFDRTQPTDDRPEVMDLFAQAIGNVANSTTSAYSLFWANVSLHSSFKKKEEKHMNPVKRWLEWLDPNPEKHKTRAEESFKYLNINPEGILLKEAQDITEELNINMEEVDNLVEIITNRAAEIEDLQKAVTRTNDQQEASIVEARTALERADETIKQGRAIMAFTIVTIFFLPLGFFSGLFGMNNKKSTGDEWMSLGEQIMYMFSNGITKK